MLAGETYNPGKKVNSSAQQHSVEGGASLSRAAGREDISVALNKLNYGIDDISKQLRGVVSLRVVRYCTLHAHNNGV